MKKMSLLKVLIAAAVGLVLLAPKSVASQSLNTYFGNKDDFLTDTAGLSGGPFIDFDNTRDRIINGETISSVTFNPLVPDVSLWVVPGEETFTPPGFTNVIDPETNKLFPTSGKWVLSPGGRELAPGPNPVIEDDSLRLTFKRPLSAVGFDILFQQLDCCSFVGIDVLGSDGSVLYTIASIPTGSPPVYKGGAFFVGFTSPIDNIKEIVVKEFDADNVFPDSNIGYDSLLLFGPPPP